MHKPRKRFGQHFLRDRSVIQQIVSAIAPLRDDYLVEIGPGQGALTLPILKMTGQLHVVEIDRDLIVTLKNACQDLGVLTVHQQDALEFDFLQLTTPAKRLRVFGNLPYNISTPLLFHLLDQASVISDMVFMLQKEVVERIAAPAQSGDYGRLSVMVQYHCQTQILFDVSPDAFDPPPKVDSSVIRLLPFHELPHVAKDYSKFAHLVRQAFSQRRKTLRNSLKMLVSNQDWEAVQLDAQLRPDQLTVADYVRLSNYITHARDLS